MNIALPEQNNISREWLATDEAAQEQDKLHVLIRDCIARSRTAQKKLYDWYAPAAYSTIKRYIYNNDGTAEEILNDAFFKILTKLGQYSFEGAFEGWIRRIVVNTITDHLRKKIKDRRILAEVQPEDAFVNSVSIEKMSYKELLKIIQTLPDAQRAVFNLFVFENYSHREIATLLNMKENNCRWHLNDARRRLKEKINFIMAQ